MMLAKYQLKFYYHTQPVGQAILPAAAFQAALGCGYSALWGRMESCAPVANRRCTARLTCLSKHN